jgi:hydrogenase maturation protease
MTDEGVGVCVVETIKQRYDLSGNVEVMDLGTGNMNVLHAIAGRQKVVFVDCALMGESPGTIRRFSLDDVVSKKIQSHWSAHDGDLLNLLNISKSLGELPEEIVLFGIEPQTIEFGEQLTPCLQEHMEEYIVKVAAAIV